MATGGGFSVSNGGQVISSAPSGGIVLVGRRPGTGPDQRHVYVVCLKKG